MYDFRRFFLGWYSNSLMCHGDRIMSAARRIFHPTDEERRRRQLPPVEVGPGAAGLMAPAAAVAPMGHASVGKASAPGSEGSDDTVMLVATTAISGRPSVAGSSGQQTLNHNSASASTGHVSFGGLSLSEHPRPTSETNDSSSSMSIVAEGEMMATSTGDSLGRCSSDTSGRNLSSGRVSTEVPSILTNGEFRPIAEEDGSGSAGMRAAGLPSAPITAIFSGREGAASAQQLAGDSCPASPAAGEDGEGIAGADSGNQLLMLHEVASEGGGGRGLQLRRSAVATTPTERRSGPTCSTSAGLMAGRASEPDLRHRERSARLRNSGSVALTLKIAGIQ